MSFRETPEQRQIRKLRERIAYDEQISAHTQERNRQLERQMTEVRRQLEEENRKLTEKLRRHEQNSRQNETQIRAQSERIRELDREVREQERIRDEKIAVLREQHTESIRRVTADFRAQADSLRDAVVSTRADMMEGFRRIGQDTDEKMRRLREENTRAIRATEERLGSRIEEVDSRVDHMIRYIKEKEEGERELARYWKEQAERLLNEIADNYRPELFAPKELEKLRGKLKIAESDLGASRYTSAADGGRQVFYDAMDLKETVIRAEMEWNFWFNALREREIQLEEMVRSAENRVYELDSDGEKIIDDSGLDYWTRGQFSIVKERIEELREKELVRLEEKETARIKELAETLIRLQEELIQLENAAHTNVAMSLNRYTLASQIGMILGDQYQMLDADGDYFGEENRDEYHAIFVNPVTGDQAAVVITPIYGEDGIVTNHAEVIIGNADNDPVTREKINEAVQSALQSEGLIEGAFPCYQRYGERTREEAERVGNIEAVSAGLSSARASAPEEAGTAPAMSAHSRKA